MTIHSLLTDPIMTYRGISLVAVSPRSQGSRSSSGTNTLSAGDSKGSGEENTKRRRVSAAKQAAETSSSSEEILSALPCLVSLNPGVRIATVAAGGRHTLALSGSFALTSLTAFSEMDGTKKLYQSLWVGFETLDYCFKWEK